MEKKIDLYEDEYIFACRLKSNKEQGTDMTSLKTVAFWTGNDNDIKTVLKLFKSLRDKGILIYKLEDYDNDYIDYYFLIEPYEIIENLN